jgi:vitamin B12 transporter
MSKSETRIKGVIGSGYKAPSVFQLYHPSPFIGNPDLRPEKSRGWEIGVEQNILSDRLSMSITFFDYDYDDLIVGVENVDQAISRGIEIAIDFSAQDFGARLDYTNCDSEDKTTGESLIRRPRHKLVFSSDYRIRQKLLATLTARYYSTRDDLDFSQFPAPRVRLSEYTIFNVSGSYEFTKHLKINGRIENMFDRKYQEAYTYGSVPLSVYAGISLSD